MLEVIHNDHINMSKLLKLLRKKIEVLKSDKEIDFRLTKNIISYLRTYSDKYHHPLEDFIYEFYLENYVVPDDISSRLPTEHKEMKSATIELDELLNMILLDAIVPKDECIERLESFVTQQEKHMSYEEMEVLPLIEHNLSDVDWIKIKQDWLHLDGTIDPLFGENVSDQYQELSAVIKKL